VVGEDVLKFTALMLNEVINELGSPNDFIGQMVVGPDFVVTSTPERLEAICARLCERFDAEIGLQYNYKDRRNGYIVVNDDQGGARQVPLMSLSIGVLTSDDGPFYDIRELSEAVEDARQHALADARERGRKSYTSVGRDDGWSGTIPHAERAAPLVTSQSPASIYAALVTRYEQASKERQIYLEMIQARRSMHGMQIQAAINDLTLRLNHDLGTAFDQLQRAIANLSKKTRDERVYPLLSWLNRQYELCDTWRRSIIECGNGFQIEKQSIDLGQWLGDTLNVLHQQLGLRLRLELVSVPSSLPAEIDPVVLRMACLYLLLAAQMAGATYLRVVCQTDPVKACITVLFEDDGASQPRKKQLQAAARSQTYRFRQQYMGFDLLWRAIMLQKIGMTFGPTHTGLQLLWHIPMPQRQQNPASFPIETLRQVIADMERENEDLKRQATTVTPPSNQYARTRARHVLKPYVTRLHHALIDLQRNAQQLLTEYRIDDALGRELLLSAHYSHLLTRNLALVLTFTPSQPEPTDMNSQITSIVAMLAYRLKNHDVELKLMPRMPPAAIADIDVQQILLNLIKNATEAISDGSKLQISISTAYRHNTITLQISDSGLGIAPAKGEGIFNLYYSTKGNGRSAGLGLPIAQALVRTIGGALGVGSSSLDKQRQFVSWRKALPDTITLSSLGTFFQIELPVAQEET
jgi:signal transduction histidine kinase